MNVGGPKGFRIFYQHLHYLLFYAMACIQENRYPSINKCWDKLSSLFLMVRNKLFYIAETDSDVADYEQFMKLAGPYWNSAG